MSRAFVKEGDGAEPRHRPIPELPEGAHNLITPRGAQSFRDRLQAAIAERAGLRTAEHGGAAGRMAELTDDISWLEGRIATFAETPAVVNPQRVGFGVTVTIANDDDTRVYTIVGVDEVEPSAGRISWLSPLARALHGAREGDEVRVSLPGGDTEWEVVSIRSLG